MSEEQKIAEQGEDNKQISKKALKKQEQEKLKAEKKAQQQQTQQQQQQQQQQEVDPLAQNYGDYEMIQSTEQTNRKWVKVNQIEEDLVDQNILVRARLHNSRVKGNLAFLVLRDQFNTVQCVAVKGEFISKQMLKYISGISCESIVDIYAKVIVPTQEILSCTQKYELQILKIYVVSRSASQLPFQIEDASRCLDKNEYEDESQQQVEDDGKAKISVNMKTRLDNRIVDLRTPAKVAIFRVQSAVGNLFREYLLNHDFIEIHTPKLIGGASEGGSNVFKLPYFGKPACLAQSPQLYKQMALMGDFDRVFEIAPVFRAENSNTHRHMCEFTSLDMEMTIKESYHELLDFLGDLCVFIFNGIEERYKKEVKAIQQQFPIEPFKCKLPVVKLTFEEGVKLLNENGVNQQPYDDLDTVNEKILGGIVKKIYDTDFYILHRYPKNARPFYTMPCKDDPNYTLSYDFFMRGEEITSGAQRIHDPVLLENRIKEMNIPVDTLRDYINAFKFGAFPHGGCALGLERVVFLYFGLANIRNSSLFPRDPIRLNP